MFQSTKELENTDEGALRVAIQQLQFTIPAPAATAGPASDAGAIAGAATAGSDRAAAFCSWKLRRRGAALF